MQAQSITYEEIGGRLKACRKKAGLTQAEFGDLAGVRANAVVRWEAGDGIPKIENLLRYGQQGIDWVWIVTGRRLDDPDLDAFTQEMVRIIAELPDDFRQALLTYARATAAAVGRLTETA